MTEMTFTGIFEMELRRDVVFEHLQLARKWVADLRSFSDEADADVVEAVRREWRLAEYLRWIDEQIEAFVDIAAVALADSVAVDGSGDDHRAVGDGCRDVGDDDAAAGVHNSHARAAGEGDR